MADLYLSNVTGMLDIDSMVQGILAVKKQKLLKLSQEKLDLQTKVSTIENVLSGINSLKDFVEGWDVDSLFNGKKVEVSNTDVLTASVTEEAPNISMDINVTQLPQAEIRVSEGGVSSLEDSLSASTITLTYWLSDTDYVTTTINFGGGTLEDLVNAINQSQNNVEASVYYDGTSYKLMLSEKDVGTSTKETSATSSVIEVSGLPTELGTTLNTIQNAQNAKLTIGSSTEEVSSPTDTFKNLISGLTVTVKSTGETSLTISEDYSQISSSISDLFDKINNLIDLVKKSTGKGDIFQGNIMFTQIGSQVFNALNPLIKLGVVNLSEDGKYSVNSEAITNLANENPDQLKAALEAVKNNLTSVAETLSDSFKAYKDSQNQLIQRIEEEQKEMQLALQKEEDKLRKRFAEIEALMYQNDQLKQRLQSLAVPISEMTKK